MTKQGETLQRRAKIVAIVALAVTKIAAVGALAACLATGCAWAQAGPAEAKAVQAKAGEAVMLESRKP